MTLQLFYALDAILRFYEILIVAYALMSWFPMRGMLYDIQRVLGSVVEPYVGIFRRFLPGLGGLDFSPLIAIVVIDLVRTFVLPRLF